jgi:peptide-methionine (S)-S-oxide reductase
VSGYAGGTKKDPYYGEVSSGKTGHAECVQVYYDTTKISFETLVKAFFASHDPTSLNRQGQDVGTEYRSIAFYRNARERRVIEKEMAQMQEKERFKNKIVTEVRPLGVFYPAEEFHQEYVQKHPHNDYVQYVAVPEFLEFKINFEANYKPIDYSNK